MSCSWAIVPLLHLANKEYLTFCPYIVHWLLYNNVSKLVIMIWICYYYYYYYYYYLLLLLFGCSDDMSMSTSTMTSSSTAVPLLPVAVEVCAGCRHPIEDRFLLRVMDNSWHERCLQCSACYEPLRQSCFVKDRRLLCRQDYDKYAISLLFFTRTADRQPINQLLNQTSKQSSNQSIFL